MLTALHNHLQETDLLPKRSKLLVAISGGVDSVTMLHLLDGLVDHYGWDIELAHYNHGLRKDAFKDAILVGDIAERYGYKLYVGKYEGSDFSEAKLRKARYDFLESLRKDIDYDLILTGHHNSDFIETAIFNTIRGSDRGGMVSLKSKRGSVVRPMLPFSKAEIIVFANLQDLTYREDSTNSDLKYSRNFVRNVLIPHGSTMFRNFHHNINRRLSRLDELNKSLEIGLGRLFSELVEYEDPKSVSVNIEKFKSLPAIIQENLFVYAIKRITESHNLAKVNIIKAVDFINESKSGSKLNLPGGLHIINAYDNLIITSDTEQFLDNVDKDIFHFLSKQKSFRNELFHLKVSDKNKLAVKLPKQKFYVRYRQPGDRVQPIGMKGTKKLQDVFVDAKIPRHMRGLWPVLVNSKNEIAWVPKLVKDRRFFDIRSNEYEYLICEVL